MAAPVGSLVVRIGSDTRGLRTGARGTRSTLRRLGNEARVAARRIGLIATAATAAAVALGTKLTRDGLQSVDAMAKLGRSLDSTQAQMVTLTRAAELAGIEQERLQRNVQAFAKRLGEAIDGTGEAQPALEKLGLTARQLAEMPLPEALALVAERTNELGTAAERAAVESDLFSRAGQGMLTNTEDLAGAIREAARDTRDFGVAVSQIDAAQVEAANDAMSRIGLVIDGISNQLAIKLAPFIQEVAERLSEAARQSQGFGTQIEDAIITGLRVGGGFLDMLRTWSIIIDGINLAWLGMKVVYLEVVDTLVEAWIDYENKVREGANKIIDGVNLVLEFFQRDLIPTLEEVERGEFGTRVAEQGKRAAIELRQAWAEFRLKLAEPLPSEAIEQFISDVRARMDKELLEFEKRSSEVGGALEPSDELQEERRRREEEARREALQRRLEDIRESLLTEAEFEQEAFEEKMERLREGLELELLTKEEFRERERELTEQHQKKMNEIEERGLTKRERFERASMARRVQMLASDLAQMTADVSNTNKTLFQINKAAAIAEAVVDAIRGAERTWDAYPYPFNIPMTAAHVASSVARIAAIRSQSFAGGGTTAPSVAASTPAGATPVSPATPGGDGATTNQIVNVSLQGDVFGRDAIRNLIEQINEALADGAQLRIV